LAMSGKMKCKDDKTGKEVVNDDGYTGKGDAKNNPDKQCEKNAGPLPRGKYKIGESYDHDSLGPVTMNLDPDSSNDICSRDLFRIHGDSKKDPGNASEGCIVLKHSSRGTISKAGGGTLTVEK